MTKATQHPTIVGHAIMLGVFVPFFFLCSAAIAFGEMIEDFTAKIDIRPNGTFTVNEAITYDFGGKKRHGIFRTIPTDHPQDASAWYLSRYTGIDVTDVLRDGEREPYEVTRENGQIRIKIGAPERTISGSHLYQIAYTVSGGLSYFNDRTDAELYWNVTGTEWEVPIVKAKAVLTGADGMLRKARSCYRGYADGTGSCVISQSDANRVTFTATDLSPGKGMTVAQSLTGDSVETRILERSNGAMLFGGAALVWFLGLGIFVYRYRTKYRTHRPVVAQYEPYASFKPMFAGLLFDGRLDPRDITAGIVSLAQKGYLSIEKIDRKVLFFFTVDDYRLTLKKPATELESPFQKDILEILFDQTTRTGETTTLHELKNNKSQQQENQKILTQMKKDLESELESAGFFEVNLPKRFLGTFSIVLVVGAIYFGGSASTFISNYIDNGFEKLIPFIVVGVVATGLLLACMYRRRTRKGYEALNHLEGFKQFLSVTEKERYAFHNAPEKSPEQFMEYLPYAIAFGVEEEWADIFKDVTIPDPDWYSGGSSGTHFSATNFATSMGAFSSAFASSSGTSASSGGGSVGGGAGGGGGGSW